MRGVIVVPRRSGVHPARDDSWRWTRKWWEQHGYPIYEVEHPGPEPFNRSWCINEGARRAWPWDVLMIVDSDSVEDQDAQVHEAMRRAYETGRFTVGHVAGKDLSERASADICAGRHFDWDPHLVGHRLVCDSRVNAIRADLFTELGGYDTRFKGWGHEDVAFTIAVGAIRPGIERIPGNSWHLWHPPMLEPSKGTRAWRNGFRLMQKYERAANQGPESVKKVMAERTPEQRWDPPEKVGTEADLYVITSGRQEYLEETLASFDEKVFGEVKGRTIIDDSGDLKFAGWLREKLPDYRILHHDTNLGFGETVAHGWQDAAQQPGAPYVFWLEEDFTFDRQVVLDDLAEVLQRDDIAQAALLRAPFFPPEIKAGSIPNEHPKSYKQKTQNGVRYLEHPRYYTTNPHLTRRDVFKWGWPGGEDGSEQLITKKLLGRGFRFAYMGWGEHWVTHIGATRNGRGY